MLCHERLQFIVYKTTSITKIACFVEEGNHFASEE